MKSRLGYGLAHERSLHGIGDMANGRKLNAMLLHTIVLDVLRAVRWALHLHRIVDIEDLIRRKLPVQTVVRSTHAIAFCLCLPSLKDGMAKWLSINRASTQRFSPYSSSPREFDPCLDYELFVAEAEGDQLCGVGIFFCWLWGAYWNQTQTLVVLPPLTAPSLHHRSAPQVL